MLGCLLLYGLPAIPVVERSESNTAQVSSSSLSFTIIQRSVCKRSAVCVYLYNYSST